MCQRVKVANFRPVVCIGAMGAINEICTVLRSETKYVGTRNNDDETKCGRFLSQGNELNGSKDVFSVARILLCYYIILLNKYVYCDNNRPRIVKYDK